MRPIVTSSNLPIGGDVGKQAQPVAVRVGEGVPESGSGRFETLERIAAAQHEGQADDDEPAQHDQRLEDIGEGDGKKPPDEGIGEHGDQGYEDRYVMARAGVIKVEDFLEELGARDQSRADA